MWSAFKRILATDYESLLAEEPNLVHNLQTKEENQQALLSLEQINISRWAYIKFYKRDYIYQYYISINILNKDIKNSLFRKLVEEKNSLFRKLVEALGKQITGKENALPNTTNSKNYEFTIKHRILHNIKCLDYVNIQITQQPQITYYKKKVFYRISQKET